MPPVAFLSAIADRETPVFGTTGLIMFESEEHFEYKEREFEDYMDMSELFFARYFNLLDRFYDLPACDELIMSQLRKEFPEDFIASLESYEDPSNLEDDLEDEEERNKRISNLMAEYEGQELPAEIRMLRQLEHRGRKLGWIFYQGIMDWSNIHIILLSTSLGKLALRVMFYLGRSMGSFNQGMDSLADHETSLGIVHFKRVQAYCNFSITLMRELSKHVTADIRAILTSRIQQIAKQREELEEHIADCRELLRLEGGL